MDKIKAEKSWVKRLLSRFKEPHLAWGMVGGYVMANMGNYFNWLSPLGYIFDFLGG